MTFEALYADHSSMVFNLALQYVQNREDAEEITQDVFVAVHQSFSSFKQESSVTTWIYRIAINKSLDYIKAKKTQKRFAFITSLFHENTSELKHDLPSFDHPGVQLEDKEALQLLFARINELPDKQKTVLILHKIEQKSQLEVAEIMGISTKAIESLMYRAKLNLSKKISNNEG